MCDNGLVKTLNLFDFKTAIKDMQLSLTDREITGLFKAIDEDDKYATSVESGVGGTGYRVRGMGCGVLGARGGGGGGGGGGDEATGGHAHSTGSGVRGTPSQSSID